MESNLNSNRYVKTVGCCDPGFVFLKKGTFLNSFPRFGEILTGRECYIYKNANGDHFIYSDAYDGVLIKVEKNTPLPDFNSNGPNLDGNGIFIYNKFDGYFWKLGYNGGTWSNNDSFTGLGNDFCCVTSYDQYGNTQNRYYQNSASAVAKRLKYLEVLDSNLRKYEFVKDCTVVPKDGYERTFYNSDEYKLYWKIKAKHERQKHRGYVLKKTNGEFTDYYFLFAGNDGEPDGDLMLLTNSSGTSTPLVDGQLMLYNNSPCFYDPDKVPLLYVGSDGEKLVYENVYKNNKFKFDLSMDHMKHLADEINNSLKLELDSNLDEYNSMADYTINEIESGELKGKKGYILKKGENSYYFLGDKNNGEPDGRLIKVDDAKGHVDNILYIGKDAKTVVDEKDKGKFMLGSLEVDRDNNSGLGLLKQKINIKKKKILSQNLSEYKFVADYTITGIKDGELEGKKGYMLENNYVSYFLFAENNDDSDGDLIKIDGTTKRYVGADGKTIVDITHRGKFNLDAHAPEIEPLENIIAEGKKALKKPSNGYLAEFRFVKVAKDASGLVFECKDKNGNTQYIKKLLDEDAFLLCLNKDGEVENNSKYFQIGDFLDPDTGKLNQNAATVGANAANKMKKDSLPIAFKTVLNGAEIKNGCLAEFRFKRITKNGEALFNFNNDGYVLRRKNGSEYEYKLCLKDGSAKENFGLLADKVKISSNGKLETNPIRSAKIKSGDKLLEDADIEKLGVVFKVELDKAKAKIKEIKIEELNLKYEKTENVGNVGGVLDSKNNVRFYKSKAGSTSGKYYALVENELIYCGTVADPVKCEVADDKVFSTADNDFNAKSGSGNTDVSGFEVVKNLIKEAEKKENEKKKAEEIIAGLNLEYVTKKIVSFCGFDRRESIIFKSRTGSDNNYYVLTSDSKLVKVTDINFSANPVPVCNGGKAFNLVDNEFSADYEYEYGDKFEYGSDISKFKPILDFETKAEESEKIIEELKLEYVAKGTVRIANNNENSIVFKSRTGSDDNYYVLTNNGKLIKCAAINPSADPMAEIVNDSMIFFNATDNCFSANYDNASDVSLFESIENLKIKITAIEKTIKELELEYEKTENVGNAGGVLDSKNNVRFYKSKAGSTSGKYYALVGNELIYCDTVADPVKCEVADDKVFNTADNDFNAKSGSGNTDVSGFEVVKNLIKEAEKKENEKKKAKETIAGLNLEYVTKGTVNIAGINRENSMIFKSRTGSDDNYYVLTNNGKLVKGAPITHESNPLARIGYYRAFDMATSKFNKNDGNASDVSGFKNIVDLKAKITEIEKTIEDLNLRYVENVKFSGAPARLGYCFRTGANVKSARFFVYEVTNSDNHIFFECDNVDDARKFIPKTNGYFKSDGSFSANCADAIKNPINAFTSLRDVSFRSGIPAQFEYVVSQREEFSGKLFKCKAKNDANTCWILRTEDGKYQLCDKNGNVTGKGFLKKECLDPNTGLLDKSKVNLSDSDNLTDENLPAALKYQVDISNKKVIFTVASDAKFEEVSLINSSKKLMGVRVKVENADDTGSENYFITKDYKLYRLGKDDNLNKIISPQLKITNMNNIGKFETVECKDGEDAKLTFAQLKKMGVVRKNLFTLVVADAQANRNANNKVTGYKIDFKKPGKDKLGAGSLNLNTDGQNDKKKFQFYDDDNYSNEKRIDLDKLDINSNESTAESSLNDLTAIKNQLINSSYLANNIRIIGNQKVATSLKVGTSEFNGYIIEIKDAFDGTLKGYVFLVAKDVAGENGARKGDLLLMTDKDNITPSDKNANRPEFAKLDKCAFSKGGRTVDDGIYSNVNYKKKGTLIAIKDYALNNLDEFKLEFKLNAFTGGKAELKVSIAGVVAADPKFQDGSNLPGDGKLYVLKDSTKLVDSNSKEYKFNSDGSVSEVDKTKGEIYLLKDLVGTASKLFILGEKNNMCDVISDINNMPKPSELVYSAIELCDIGTGARAGIRLVKNCQDIRLYVDKDGKFYADKTSTMAQKLDLSYYPKLDNNNGIESLFDAAPDGETHATVEGVQKWFDNVFKNHITPYALEVDNNIDNARNKKRVRVTIKNKFKKPVNVFIGIPNKKIYSNDTDDTHSKLILEEDGTIKVEKDDTKTSVLSFDSNDNKIDNKIKALIATGDLANAFNGLFLDGEIVNDSTNENENIKMFAIGYSIYKPKNVCVDKYGRLKVDGNYQILYEDTGELKAVNDNKAESATNIRDFFVTGKFLEHKENAFELNDKFELKGPIVQDDTENKAKINLIDIRGREKEVIVTAGEIKGTLKFEVDGFKINANCQEFEANSDGISEVSGDLQVLCAQDTLDAAVKATIEALAEPARYKLKKILGLEEKYKITEIMLGTGDDVKKVKIKMQNENNINDEPEFNFYVKKGKKDQQYIEANCSTPAKFKFDGNSKLISIVNDSSGDKTDILGLLTSINYSELDSDLKSKLEELTKFVEPEKPKSTKSDSTKGLFAAKFSYKIAKDQNLKELRLNNERVKILIEPIVAGKIFKAINVWAGNDGYVYASKNSNDKLKTISSFDGDTVSFGGPTEIRVVDWFKNGELKEFLEANTNTDTNYVIKYILEAVLDQNYAKLTAQIYDGLKPAAVAKNKIENLFVAKAKNGKLLVYENSDLKNTVSLRIGNEGIEKIEGEFELPNNNFIDEVSKSVLAGLNKPEEKIKYDAKFELVKDNNKTRVEKINGRDYYIVKAVVKVTAKENKEQIFLIDKVKNNIYQGKLESDVYSIVSVALHSIFDDNGTLKLELSDKNKPALDVKDDNAKIPVKLKEAVRDLEKFEPLKTQMSNKKYALNQKYEPKKLEPNLKFEKLYDITIDNKKGTAINFKDVENKIVKIFLPRVEDSFYLIGNDGKLKSKAKINEKEGKITEVENAADGDKLSESTLLLDILVKKNKVIHSVVVEADKLELKEIAKENKVKIKPDPDKSDEIEIDLGPTKQNIASIKNKNGELVYFDVLTFKKTDKDGKVLDQDIKISSEDIGKPCVKVGDNIYNLNAPSPSEVLDSILGYVLKKDDYKKLTASGLKDKVIHSSYTIEDVKKSSIEFENFIRKYDIFDSNGKVDGKKAEKVFGDKFLVRKVNKFICAPTAVLTGISSSVFIALVASNAIVFATPLVLAILGVAGTISLGTGSSALIDFALTQGNRKRSKSLVNTKEKVSSVLSKLSKLNKTKPKKEKKKKPGLVNDKKRI